MSALARPSYLISCVALARTHHATCTHLHLDQPASRFVLRMFTLLLLSLAKYLPYIATATPRGTLLVRPFALIHIRKVARWCPTCSPTCMLDHKSAILCANPLTTVAADSCDSLKSRLQVGRPVHESPYHGGSRLVRLVKSKEKKGSPFFLLNLTSRTSRLPPW